MVMSEYLPLILYTVPFVVAAAILTRAQLEKLCPEPEVDDKSVVTRDDPMVEEVRSHPIRRPYISYTVYEH